MLLKIIRYIKGYIRIRVIGYSSERFLNACSHKGIFLWGLKPVGGAYEMNITIKGFRQLKPIIRKTGTKVVIVRRFGLPFFLHKYRKRKLFFGGAFLFGVMIIAMSRFIWNIDITGNQSRTDESILEFLGSKNIEDGMPKSDVDCARIVKDIRKEYDDIIWVSASIKGTRLIIQVKENEDSLPVVNKTEEEKEQEARKNATDIVADQECVITDIVPRKGIAMVKEGDQVKKGDILISGQVPVNNDAGETIAYQYHESDADIRGQTAIAYEDSQEVVYQEKEYLDVQKEEYYIRVGDRFLRLATIKNHYEEWEMHSKERQLRIGKNFYLPVSYGIRTANPYRSEEKKHTKKELQQILSLRFKRYLADLEKKGVEIIENSVKIYTGPEKAEAKGTLTVIMPIGTQAPSQLLEIPLKEEQEETGE